MISHVAEFMQSQQAYFQQPEMPCYAISDFPDYVVNKATFSGRGEQQLYYVFPSIFKALFEYYGDRQVKQALHSLDWLKKPKTGWVHQLYGKGKDGKRCRLGYFLLFDGIAPSRLAVEPTDNTFNTNNRRQTMNSPIIIPLNFENNIIRIDTSAENPLFVAKDVAVALGYEKPENAINRHCKGSPFRGPLSTKGGIQEVRMIEEPDVYRLIFGSKLESAQRFQNWVFEEVLPSIRKTGGYEYSFNSKPLSQSELIRYHNLHLKLLKEFNATSSLAMREGIYHSLELVAEQLGFPLMIFDEMNAE